MNKTQLKSVLQKAGLFTPVRRWYRRLNPTERKKRSAMRRYYGHFVRPGDLCFDIGANLGQTLEALIACGATVVSVEPNPLCMASLRREYGSNPRVTLVEKAVGAEVGHADLHFQGTDATGSLRDDWPFECPSSRRVPVTTLDGLIAEFGRPDYCKIDVEGYEREVVAGLSQPIRTLSFEFHRGELSRAHDCLEHLRSIGRVEQANIGDVLDGGVLDDFTLLFPEWLDDAQLTDWLRNTNVEVGNVIVRTAVS